MFECNYFSSHAAIDISDKNILLNLYGREVMMNPTHTVYDACEVHVHRYKHLAYRMNKRLIKMLQIKYVNFVILDRFLIKVIVFVLMRNNINSVNAIIIRCLQSREKYLYNYYTRHA